ncbi:TPA: hypothetical protein ACH3X1_002797 [Trebouxia sp. C0004]
MHACGVGNPVHAGDIIAQSKATAASCFRANLDPHTCLGDCYLHLRAWPACIFVEESAPKAKQPQNHLGF